MVKEFEELTQTGNISIENQEILFAKGLALHGQVGIQISESGRIWLNVNGISFIRFAPTPNNVVRPICVVEKDERILITFAKAYDTLLENNHIHDANNLRRKVLEVVTDEEAVLLISSYVTLHYNS